MSHSTTINWNVSISSGSVTVKLFDPEGNPVFEPTEVIENQPWNSGNIGVSKPGNYQFTYTWTSGYQRIVSGTQGNFLDINAQMVDYHVEGEAESENCQFTFSRPIQELPLRPIPTYEVDGSHIVPNEPYFATFAVIGADAQVNGTSDDYPVTMMVRFANDLLTYEPFGPYNNPKTGLINQDEPGITQRATVREIVDRNPENTRPKRFQANQAFAVTCRSWRNQSGIMQPFHTVSGGSNLIILQNGDPIPQFPGDGNEDSLQQFLEAVHLTDGETVKCLPNQAILCYELTSSNPGQGDFQDAVLLLTLFPAGR